MDRILVLQGQQTFTVCDTGKKLLICQGMSKKPSATPELVLVHLEDYGAQHSLGDGL